MEGDCVNEDQAGIETLKFVKQRRFVQFLFWISIMFIECEHF